MHSLPIVTRRAFLRAGAGSAVGLALAPSLLPAATGFGVELGYAAITWEGHDEQAIADIAAVGFHAIQLRSGVYDSYGEKPAALRRLLEDNGLALMCFSSGTVDAVPEREQQHLDVHVRNARFVAALGGRTLQLISHRPDGRAPRAAEFERLGRLMNEIGRRSADLGVRVVYHNHMGGFGEAPDEIAKVLEATEPRLVGLLLDVAHYTQGGGDAVAAIARHLSRLAMLHLKDVLSPVPAGVKAHHDGYEFVELGKGRVDLPGVVAALEKNAWNGPAVIELDSVPATAPGSSPKDCAARNKSYVVETLGLRV